MKRNKAWSLQIETDGETVGNKLDFYNFKIKFVF